jgi:hypothetical protein
MPSSLGARVLGLIPSEGGLEDTAFIATDFSVSGGRFDTGVCPPVGLDSFLFELAFFTGIVYLLFDSDADFS